MSVAFVHVDLDDVWALGECYGFPVPEDERHWVYRDGLPRFVEIFREFGIKATFFVVGADAEQSLPAAMLRDLTATGHRLANHSYSHNLRLRSLEETAIREEVRRAHEAIHASTGIKPIGFRAPGYGISKTLLQVLTEQGYRYDSSLMPTPFGGVFRWLDGRLRKRYGTSSPQKAQYPMFSDCLTSLRPFHPIGEDSGGQRIALPLTEIPVAASPFLRLPTQAGVCMQLGLIYFAAIALLYRSAPNVPWVFLAHGVDLTDFSASRIPLLRESRFFSLPIAQRCDFYRRFLENVLRLREVVLVEEWVETFG
ncbi:MAG: DUF2334 domain-containing protein [Candidatus Hydrogenedentota bacterium]|nr:polysaccharide deacetylase family protein [Candidatus Sumerlaea chitinivorans]RMH30281.1 MAG: DUF2334 domain-containing protein [Candidatus Hydrogenedentota bacterium]